MIKHTRPQVNGHHWLKRFGSRVCEYCGLVAWITRPTMYSVKDGELKIRAAELPFPFDPKHPYYCPMDPR